MKAASRCQTQSAGESGAGSLAVPLVSQPGTGLSPLRRVSPRLQTSSPGAASAEPLASSSPQSRKTSKTRSGHQAVLRPPNSPALASLLDLGNEAIAGKSLAPFKGHGETRVHFWGMPTICLTRVLMSGKRPIKVRPSNLVRKPLGSPCAEPPKTDQRQSASSSMVVSLRLVYAIHCERQPTRWGVQLSDHPGPSSPKIRIGAVIGRRSYGVLGWRSMICKIRRGITVRNRLVPSNHIPRRRACALRHPKLR
jgi:hypothetical protein